MSTKAMQFDGTFGSAKAVAEWVGDPSKINAGPWNHFHQEDGDDGGLDLMTGSEEGGDLYYHTVAKGSWVVATGEGFVAMTAEQYAAAFPAEA